MWWMVAVALVGAQDSDESADTDVPAAEAAVEIAGPDRSAPPEVKDAVWMVYPEAERLEIREGVEAWVVPVKGVRTAVVSVHVGRGAMELGQGWSSEVLAMDAHATLAVGDLDPGALQSEMALLDLSIWTTMGEHSSSFGMEVPREHLDQGLERLSDLIVRPTYPSTVVRNEQRDWVRYYEQAAPKSLSSVTRLALRHAWYGAGHPYNRPVDLRALGKVKGSDLVEAAEAWRNSGPVRILVVGDVNPDEMQDRLAGLSQEMAAAGTWSTLMDLPSVDGGRVIAVDMPGQTQAAVRLRMPAPTGEEEEQVAFEAARWIYGGHFLSRLNANLREERGFTYGSRASYGYSRNEGMLTVSVDVKVENVSETVQQIRKELDRLIDEGVTEDELDMLKRAKVADWNVLRQTASDAWNLYRGAMVDGERIADLSEKNAQLSDLTVADLQAVAKQYMGASQPHYWVVVGDRTQLEGQLEQAGLEAEWLDPVQAVLGGF